MEDLIDNVLRALCITLIFAITACAAFVGLIHLYPFYLMAVSLFKWIEDKLNAHK